MLRLELHCFQDVSFSKLDLKTLRFFLLGDGSLTHTLIELLTNNCIQVVARDLSAPAKKVVILPPDSMRQVGFAADEGMMPFAKRSFWGYRLLQEYFTFPEKFLFLDISGYGAARRRRISASKSSCLFFISDFERNDRRQAIELGLSESTFPLGCAPVVNLFNQTAEPILLDQKRFEYRIVPDARREQAFDIFSVEHVTGSRSGSPEIVDYEPFYSWRHSRSSGSNAFWHISRRPSPWRSDKGSDVYITFADLTGTKSSLEQDTITLASLMHQPRSAGAASLSAIRKAISNSHGGGPISQIVSLVKPTDAILPPAACLAVVASGLSTFLELSLHRRRRRGRFSRDPQAQQFRRILSRQPPDRWRLSLQSQPHFTRLLSEQGVSFARGTRVELELDEDQFVGAGVYTFGAVLDVFLALYTSVNSFSQLVLRTRQRKGVMKQWPARSGKKILS